MLLKIVLHLLVILLLTVVTQIGGVVYLLALPWVKKKAAKRRLKRLGIFAGLYLLATFLVVPFLAPKFGREKITDSEFVQAHSFFYKLANRNYVRPELNLAISEIATRYNERNSGMQLVYLDANFPFIDGFPLLPHRSHDDGKKVDVTLVYEADGQLTNKKPSVSGYGVFEGPKPGEYDQIDRCKLDGHWQYDFPKYLSFGNIHRDITFSKKGTRDLARTIARQREVGKLFLEPHLKIRLGLTSAKVRYHGCRAVRHDDHIHFQLR